MRFLQLFLLLTISTTLSAQIPPSKFIHYDQFGYLPDAEKVAVISDPIQGYNAADSFEPTSTFQLVNAENETVVFEAIPEAWNGGATHSDSGDRGWWFNFSSVTTAGTYYIREENSNHYTGKFEISPYVYSDVLKAATKMFYYNRCNFPKDATYAGDAWADGSNFMHPGQDGECKYLLDPNNASLFRDLSGGWWDAGDYNKYVTFAEQPVHNLLAAFEENPEVFGDDFNIPESNNGIPDIIDEIKYELDWLMKMCNDDGSVHIKMGSTSFNDNVQARPSLNVDPRFYGPTCTSASLAIAQNFSYAALVFRNIEGLEGYAANLGTQAEKCFAYALPFLNNGNLETNCDDQTINAGDADRNVEYQRHNALTAAIYLLDLTGKSEYNVYINSNFSDDATPVNNYWWGPYSMPLQDALMHYTTMSGVNNNVVNAILSNIQGVSNPNSADFYGFKDSDLYRSYMPTWSYHWGSNSPKATYSNLNNLMIRYDINSGSHSDYRKQVTENIHFFHGVNPMGLVLLSNMYDLGAEKGINEIYHSWFKDGSEWDNTLTSTYGPAPGYLTGGPNKDFTIGSISPPSGNPPQKSYLDFNTGWPDNSWEISEPAIYYQAAYLRMLANATMHKFVSGINNPVANISNQFSLFPNPVSSRSALTISFTKEKTGIIDVLDLQGKLINQVSLTQDKRFEIVLDQVGIYIVRYTDENGEQFAQQVSVK